MIAYVDGDAAGWARIGPRPSQQRIVHTRAIVRATGEPLDDDGVWSLTCFAVRTRYRGRGLNSVLLAAAVDLAETRGDCRGLLAAALARAGETSVADLGRALGRTQSCLETERETR